MWWFLKTKIFLAIFSVFILLFATLLWLFSPLGNSYVSQLLSAQLESKTGFAWNVRNFKLTPSSFLLDFSAQNEQLELFAQGEYSLISKNLNGSFLLNSKGFTLELGKIKSLESLHFFNNQSLTFEDNTWIDGKFSGSFSHYFLQAQSNLFHSNSDFSGYFSYLEMQNILLDIKGASLALIFKMLKEPIYSDGILDINIALHKSPETEKGNLLNGNLLVNLEGGDLDSAVFLENFHLTIPQTHFIAQAQGEIHQNTLEYDFKMYSSFGDAFLKGSTNIQSLATNTDFDIKLQNLSPLSPFFKIPLNGRLDAKGSARGDTKNMLLQGGIQLEKSPLTFRLNLQDLKPHTLQISSENLESKALFTLLNQPTYLEGVLKFNANLRDFTQGISGSIQINGAHLFINSPLLEITTHIGFPSTAFQLSSQIELAQGNGVLEYSLDSNIANFKSKNGTITLQPFSFTLPQEITVHNLQNLSYYNKSLFNGSLSAKGVATQNSLELKGEITQNNKTYPTTLVLNQKNLNLYLSNLTSAQFYTLFPKIPRYFSGLTNLHLQRDFTNQTQHINLDINHLKFQNTTLAKNLNTLHCKNLNNSTLIGHIYNQLTQDNLLQSAISLQDKSKNLHIQSSKIVTNLQTGKTQGNLKLKCDKTEKEASLSGTIYRLRFNTLQ